MPLVDTQTASPGDVVLCHGRGLVSKLIRFGEALPWRAGSYWNHAAILLSATASKDWLVAQATAKGVERSLLSTICPDGRYVLAQAPLTDDGRALAVSYAQECLGVRYGWVTILSIVLNLLTPRAIRIDIRSSGTLICSALVARSWEHGGWDCPGDPFEISPAELAIALDVQR